MIFGLDVIGNKAAIGGAIYAENSTIIFLDSVTTVAVINNTADNYGGALVLVNSHLKIDFGHNVTFSNNRAKA